MLGEGAASATFGSGRKAGITFSKRTPALGRHGQTGKIVLHLPPQTVAVLISQDIPRDKALVKYNGSRPMRNVDTSKHGLVIDTLDSYDMK
jgi:hypothetical protein